MDKDKLIDKIQEIQDKNWNEFQGSNEYQLATRVDIADHVESIFEQEREKVKEALTSDVFIDNCCLSYDHAFGLLNEAQKKDIRFQAKEWFRSILNNLPHFKEANADKEEWHFNEEGLFIAPSIAKKVIDEVNENMTIQPQEEEKNCFDIQKKGFDVDGLAKATVDAMMEPVRKDLAKIKIEPKEAEQVEEKNIDGVLKAIKNGNRNSNKSD